MMIVVLAASYFVAALVSTALLIRLRPEWMLSSHVDGAEAEFLSWLTEDEKRNWREWNRYNMLYADEKADLKAAVKLRREKARASGPPPTYYGLAVPEWLLIFTPILVVVGVPVSMVIRAATRSVNNQTKTRAELEKELAAARKEVDDLMQRGEL